MIVIKFLLYRSIFFFLRDQLKQHYNLGEYYLDVDLNDLSSYDELLADKLMKSPAEYIPLVRSSISFHQAAPFEKIV